MKLTQEQIDAGWKEWAGGDGPPAELVEGVTIETRHRNGVLHQAVAASIEFCPDIWAHRPDGMDIIAYRIVEVTND